MVYLIKNKSTFPCRKKTPELVQTLQLKREHLTYVGLEFQDKWAYLGTDRGNIYVMQLVRLKPIYDSINHHLNFDWQTFLATEIM